MSNGKKNTASTLASKRSPNQNDSERLLQLEFAG